MAIKIITSFSALMRLAAALGQARKKGDAAEILKTQQEHDTYVELVRTSEMTLGLNRGALP